LREQFASEGDKTVPSPWWIVSLSSYYFYINASPSKETVDLECVVTDAITDTPQYGTEQHLTLFYDPTGSATLQGNIYGNDDSYQILLSTNSSVYMQHVQWALTLPPNITKLFYVNGSPSATTGGYPYTVDACYLNPLTAEPALAEVALPEITAGMPEDLRKALERRRERPVRLHEARLRVMPKR
jgi:hypothetical protein